MKQVQISEDLFLSLVKYHILEYYNDEEKIVKELKEKYDKIVNRKLYTKYKTAPTEEEKEKARTISWVFPNDKKSRTAWRIV